MYFLYFCFDEGLSKVLIIYCHESRMIGMQGERSAGTLSCPLDEAQWTRGINRCAHMLVKSVYYMQGINCGCLQEEEGCLLMQRV